MSDTNQTSALISSAEPAGEPEEFGKRPYLASVSVSRGSYLAASSVFTFAAALFLRSQMYFLALLAVIVAWGVVTTLALTDKVVFDGHFLMRRGVVPFLIQLISGRRQQLRISDLERVDTSAVRTLRRGGRVRYHYRSQVSGKGACFIFSSSSRGYRKMVRQLFPLIHNDKIDLRTRELRDYLCDPKSLNKRVEALQLASAAVLDEATSEFKLGGKKEAGEVHHKSTPSTHDIERAVLLRELGNNLRIAGRLREAGEAFRRALNVLPGDGWLIYDFARLLRSQASALGDARLLTRARAALRLSSRRANEDASLLSLIGESFLEFSEAARAEQSFHRTVDLQPSHFRARVGLADIALRHGKLAHVINHYRDAAEATSEKALVVYARREADYYVRISDDDNYLTAELSRINWLQTLTGVRRLAARVTNGSVLIALAGPFIAAEIGEVGWALASSSLVAWLSSLLATRILSERRKPRPVD